MKKYDIYRTGDINKSGARKTWEAGVMLSKSYIKAIEAERRGSGGFVAGQAWREFADAEKHLRMMHHKYGPKNRPLPDHLGLLRVLRTRYGMVGPEVTWDQIMDRLDPLLGV